MISLTHLPEEVIAQIVDVAPWTLFFLWESGDRSLQAKIMRSCRSFELIDPSRTLILQRWPSLLAQLPRLEFVRIRVKRVWCRLNSIAEHLKNLPNSLLCLELLFEGSNLLLVEDADLETFYAKRKAKHPNGTPLWDVKEHFPQLQTLSLQPTFQMIPVTTDSFSVFPESLTKLQWSTSLLQPSHDFSKLPRGLLEFNIFYGHAPFSFAQMKSLPPDLKRLIGPGVHMSALNALPSTIEEAPLNSTSVKFSSQTAAQFPFTLKRLTLKLQTVVDAPWEALPPRLECLDFVLVKCHPLDLRLLPNSLTEICSLRFDGFDDYLALYPKPEDAVFSWPPLLSKLDFGESFSLPSARLVTFLPKTLVTLRNLFVQDKSIWEVCADLPRSLTHLEVNSTLKTNPHVASPLNLALLPPGLTFLASNIDLPATAFSQLPRGLKYLHLHDKDIFDEAAAVELSKLPTKLRNLRIGTIEVSLFHHFPRGLLALEFSFRSPTEVNYSSLPPRLRSLRLKPNKDHPWGSSFASLPSSVRAFYPEYAPIEAKHVNLLADHVHLDNFVLPPPLYDSVADLSTLSPRWKAFFSEKLRIDLK